MMTITSRTRKGHTAKALAATVAVLAVLAASLMFAAGAANADDVGVENHNHKFPICHYVEGKGETKGGYNIIEVDEHAWQAHQREPGTYPDAKFNGSCPAIPDPTTYSATKSVSLTHDAFCYHYGDVSAITVTATETKTSIISQGTSDGYAMDAAQKAAEDLLKVAMDKYKGHHDGACTVYTATWSKSYDETLCYAGKTRYVDIDVTGHGSSRISEGLARLEAKADATWQLGVAVVTELAQYPRHTDGACTEPEVFRAEYPDAWVATICLADETVDVNEQVVGIGTSPESYDLALAAAELDAAEQIADIQTEYGTYTEGACLIIDQGFTATATVNGNSAFCTTDGRDISFDYSGTATRESGVSQDDANALAQASAVAAGQQNLTNLLAPYPGATTGACVAPDVAVPAPVTAVEAATVAAPAPATVSAPEPATVAAPAAATVPETVPAGDGSSAPQSPVWMLALVGLGTLGLALGGVRIASQRRI